MTLPDTKRIRPAGNGTESEDHTGGATYSDSTADTAAERAVAGALLLAAPRLAGEILAVVADDDVADPRCRFVVKTVRRMVAEAHPVDELTVAGYVRSHNLLAAGPTRVMLSTQLHEIAAAAPVPMSGTYYAAMVAEAAQRRRVAAAGRRMAELAFGVAVDTLAELVAVAEVVRRVSEPAVTL